MTKTPKFNKGDRVMHSYLGAGTVEQAIKSAYSMYYAFAYVVRFDETPDVSYNSGRNPTMVYTDTLMETIE
jgi:hypothetical protein